MAEAEPILNRSGTAQAARHFLEAKLHTNCWARARRHSVSRFHVSITVPVPLCLRRWHSKNSGSESCWQRCRRWEKVQTDRQTDGQTDRQIDRQRTHTHTLRHPSRSHSSVVYQAQLDVSRKHEAFRGSGANQDSRLLSIICNLSLLYMATKLFRHETLQT